MSSLATDRMVGLDIKEPAASFGALHPPHKWRELELQAQRHTGAKLVSREPHEKHATSHRALDLPAAAGASVALSPAAFSAAAGRRPAESGQVLREAVAEVSFEDPAAL